MQKNRGILMVLVGTLVLVGMVFSVSAAITENVPVPAWTHWAGENKVIVACSDNCTTIVSGSDAGMFRMYDKSGKILWTYPIQGKPVTSGAISGNGKFAAAAFSTPHEGDIVYFDHEGTILWNNRDDSIVPRNVAISKDGSVIVASSDKEMSVFDSKGQMVAHTSMTREVCRVVISGDGTMSAIAAHPYCAWRGMDGILSLMNSDGTIRFSSPVYQAFKDVSISDQGEIIAGVNETELFVFDGNGTMVWNFSSNPQFRSVAISSDGMMVAAGSQYLVRVFNRTGSLLWKYQDRGWVNAISMSRDGSFVFAGSSDTLVLFDRTGTLLWKYTTTTDVSSVAAAGDGSCFVAGTRDKIYFFNRWGNATIFDDPEDRVADSISPPPTVPALPPATPKPAPLPAGIVYGSLVCAVFLIARRER